MNADPRDVRADLAALLPAPVERDLPSDRHRLIQEFVMNEIHPDQPPAERRARRASSRRRLILASVLTGALAATAAVVVIGTGGSGGVGGSGGPAAGPAPATAAASGQQILLAAAATAEQAPATTGTYWYRRNECKEETQEIWIRKDGHAWIRTAGTNGEVRDFGTLDFGDGVSFSFAQLQQLPTKPAELKRRLVDAAAKNDPTADAAMRDRTVIVGLLGLLKMPAPPKVRAAAFQALATYPQVAKTGATDGGEGLSIRPGGPVIELVVDPATAQIRQTNLVVMRSGARPAAMCKVTAEWTDQLPG